MLGQAWALDAQVDDRHRDIGVPGHIRHQTPTARFHSLTPHSSPDTTAFLQAFTPDEFHDAPLVAVSNLLSLEALSISEDALLLALFRYLASLVHVPPYPLAWTPSDRERIQPYLLIFIPLIRPLSLSPHVFLRYVEPLHILSEQQLIAKYRFDVIAAAHLSSCDASPHPPMSLTHMRTLYPTPSARRAVVAGLRGRAVIAESAHPYRAGRDDVVAVTTSPWAPRMLFEFDRRSDIGAGASLTFYADAKCAVVTHRWRELWGPRRASRSVKRLVFDGVAAFVMLSVAPDAKPRWGWKVLAVPLLRDDDFVHACGEPGRSSPPS